MIYINISNFVFSIFKKELHYLIIIKFFVNIFCLCKFFHQNFKSLKKNFVSIFFPKHGEEKCFSEKNVIYFIENKNKILNIYNNQLFK